MRSDDPLPPFVLFVGPMFAGKTTHLLRAASLMRAHGREVVMVKPKRDVRYATDAVVSHDGEAHRALPVDRWDVAIPKGGAILFDEIQFFAPPHFEGDILDVIQACRAAGNVVHAAGLDRDWRGDPFPVTEALSRHATAIVRLKARCDVCGLPASRTGLVPGRTIHGTDCIGGSETYRPMCVGCFESAKRTEAA